MMHNKLSYIGWLGMFMLCAALGFLEEPSVPVGILMTLLSAAFFIPPAVLIWKAEERDVLLVRNLAGLSLLLTAVLLILNILSALSTSAALGAFLHGMLAVVSVPMLCSRHWALSLFLWAVLLLSAQRKTKK